jgi:hypothetical protein
MVMAQILSRSVKSIERDKAIKEEVDSALRLVPNDGYLVMIAALFQTDMDWLAEAEATFQRAIEINPREPKVFYKGRSAQRKLYSHVAQLVVRFSSSCFLSKG